MEASRRRGRAAEREPSVSPSPSSSSSSLLLLSPPPFSFSLSSSPSVDPLLLSHVCASTYPFRPFRWNEGGGRARSSSLSDRHLSLSQYPSHPTRLARSFLLLFFFPSRDYGSFHDAASSAFNCHLVRVDVRELLFSFCCVLPLPPPPPPLAYALSYPVLSSISFKLDKYLAPPCVPSVFLNFFLGLFMS